MINRKTKKHLEKKKIHITNIEIQIRMATDLLSETVQVGSLWSNIFKVLRGKKKCQHRILYLVKSSFKNKGHFFKLERDGILLSHKKNEIMPFVAA